MKLSLPGTYANKIVKAIAEFELLNDGDRILVGLSGGKDSAFLLYALAALRKHLAINFDLAALTVDYGFPDTDYSPLEEFCQLLQLPFYVEETRIGEYILSEKRNNPCAKCAHFRKGAMVQFMKKNKYNKLAFGHHYNDAVETFLMSIIYSGGLVTFQPRQYLSENSVYIIRPLVYLREKYIKEIINEIAYQPLNSPCPLNGRTTRDKIKELIREFSKEKHLFFNIASAMRHGAEIELWPEAMEKGELSERIRALWKGE